MKTIEKILTPIVIFFLKLFEYFIKKIKNFFKKGINATKAIVIFILTIFCLIIIRDIFPERVISFKVIVWVMVVAVIATYIWSVSKIIGRIIMTLLIVGSFLLAMTIWSPGWKSTLIFYWKHFDNNSFSSYNPGETLRKKIQDKEKAKEDSLLQVVTSLTDAGKIDEAIIVYSEYKKLIEKRKHQLDSIANHKHLKQVNYQPDQNSGVQRSRYIDTTITFKAGKPKVTGIYLEPNDKVWYRDVVGKFKVKNCEDIIIGDENHRAYENGWLEIRGVTNGSVRVVVMPLVLK